MKTLNKRWLTAIVAIVLLAIVSLSFAFKPGVSISKKVTQQVWLYKLSSMNPIDVDNPANYQLAPANAPACSGKSIICRITDEPSSSNPAEPALSHGSVLTNVGDYAAQFKN